MDILYVGLGRMGAPMAGHLSKVDEYKIHVRNRTASKVPAWLEKYNGIAYDAQNQKYDVIIICVGGDLDVEEQLLGPNGVLRHLKPDGLVIDHTTTSAKFAQKMSETLQQQGQFFIDAPVSGGQAGAENGTLSCMMGGKISACGRAHSVLKHYCKSITRIGDTGAGQIAKMANQLCIAGTLAGLSEAIKLIEQEPGLDSSAVFDAISGGAAQSWQMDNRFKTMVEGSFDFGFSLDHMIKDLGFALDKAKEQGWEPKTAAYVQEIYESLSKQNKGNQDTSALVEFYRSL